MKLGNAAATTALSNVS